MQRDNKITSVSLDSSDRQALDNRTVHAGKQIALAFGLGMASAFAGALWIKTRSKFIYGAATLVAGFASLNSAFQAYRECKEANAIEDSLVWDKPHASDHCFDEISEKWTKRVQSSGGTEKHRVR